MEGKQQVTSPRQVQLINAVKVNGDSFENASVTTSQGVQLINHQHKDDNNNYTCMDHLKDFFENEMNAYHMASELSDASIVR